MSIYKTSGMVRIFYFTIIHQRILQINIYRFFQNFAHCGIFNYPQFNIIMTIEEVNLYSINKLYLDYFAITWNQLIRLDTSLTLNFNILSK